MDEEFSMDGFQNNPWGAAVSPLSDSYSNWVPEEVTTTSYVNTPSYVTATNTDTGFTSPISNVNYSLPSAGDFLKGAQNLADWGLKFSSTIFNANNQAKDQQLNNYLKKAQVSVFQTQADSAREVANLNAKTNSNLAHMRINAANTGATAANLGNAVGNNSLMLWLTIAGVALAFVQVANSAK